MHIDIEYRLYNLDNDSEYITGVKTMKQAKQKAKEIKNKYLNKLVLLDILIYTEEEGLTKHIQII